MCVLRFFLVSSVMFMKLWVTVQSSNVSLNRWDLVLTTPAQELLQFLLYILYLLGQFTESYMKNNIIVNL